MAEATATARELYGLVGIAGLCVALPAAAIREAVPCPAALEPFPETCRGLAGAIDLRGQLIPVLDLAALLSGADAGGPTPIVVILRQGSSVFGVLAEAIHGVSLIGAERIDPLDFGTAGHQSLVTATFHLGSRSGVLLDLPAVAALPGLPVCTDRVGTDRRQALAEEPTLILKVGGLRCALPAGCVDATVPWQDLAPAPLDDPMWIALLPYKGAQIPVVDTLALLDHGALPAGRRSGAAVVLRVARGEEAEPAGRGLVALLIGSVDDIVRFAAEAVLPLPAGTPGTVLARGVVQREDGPSLLLDATALASDGRLVKLGQIEQRDGEASAGPGATGAAGPGRASQEPFLVFAVGTADYAVQLGIVEEILPAGQPLVPLPSGGKGMLGLFPRRGAAVPLVELASCLGTGSADAPGEGDGFIMVIRFERGGQRLRIGYRIDALRSVDRTVPQRLASDSGRSLGLLDTTIRLGSGAACSVLDLAAIAQDILVSAAG